MKKVPLAFTAKTRSHSSEVTSSMGKVVMMPAQVTRPSTRPNSRSASVEDSVDLGEPGHVGA